MAGVGEKMMVSALTGVMSPVLGKLAGLMEQEYSKLRGVRKKMEQLRKELITINLAVEQYASMDDDPDKLRRAWVKEIRELAYDIEDCIDLFVHRSNHEFSAGGGVRRLLLDSISKLRGLHHRHKFAAQIQQLKNTAGEIHERNLKYKADGCSSAATPPHTEIDPRLPALYEEAERLVGIERQMEEIITRFLVLESTPTNKCSIISIVGQGGLGKTTLARQVYLRIRGEYKCSAFLSVSQRPNMNSLLRDMLSKFQRSSRDQDSDQQIGASSDQQLIDHLRAYLEDKRLKDPQDKGYLVVIDDIWSTTAWKTIQCALPTTIHASRIIITTRINNIAESCCTPCKGFVYKMEPLSRQNSEILFVKRIFGANSTCPSQLKEIMNEILDKCDGLPLAIVTLASMLANNRRKEEWERVLKSIGSTHEKYGEWDTIHKILSLSYNDLPLYLRPCLLYLTTFPEDYEIDKSRLIWSWICEGFITTKQQYSLDEVENFVTVLDGQENSSQLGKIRRLLFQNNDEPAGAISLGTMELSHLRSLNSFGVSRLMPPLQDLQVLRVLDLEDYPEENGQGLYNYLENIGCLLHLRYLALSWIEKLPVQIGKLEFLQTLDLLGTNIEELPETLIQLKRLIRLVGNGLRLPGGFGQMEALQELWDVDVGICSINFVEDLQNLKQLRALGVHFYWLQSGYSKIGLRALASSLCNMGEHNLRYLQISNDTKHGDIDCLVDSWCGPQRSLECFVLGGSYDWFPRLPKWSNPSFSELTNLQCNVELMEKEDLDMLGELPALLVLELIVEKTPKDGLRVGQNGFSCLTCLVFYDIYGPGLMFEEYAMPKLEKLYLGLSAYSAYNAYGGFGLGIRHLSSLNLYSISVGIERKCKYVPETKAAAMSIINNEFKSLPHPPKVEFTIIHVYGDLVEESELETDFSILSKIIKARLSSPLQDYKGYSGSPSTSNEANSMN
ncbi:hypothetical protein OsI_33669 [Oryza sativa Indica Group]|uniref:Uncharacterized protein n=1 Tax=Oryza sativa subsp. indica TaxID=39946 RepID=B8BGY3_ORYSI|nr:hypothetical protein OsI_33669 [Oryza sativa Indica Group]